MKLTSILAIYVLFWAFSFFLVLPFRLRSRTGEDERIPGQAESAPPHFSFARTAKWTTLVAAILFGLYYCNYVYGWAPAETFDLFTPERGRAEGNGLPVIPAKAGIHSALR